MKVCLHTTTFIYNNKKGSQLNMKIDILRIGKGPHSVEIDLMQPLDPGKKKRKKKSWCLTRTHALLLEKSPKVHVPNLNHIGL